MQVKASKRQLFCFAILSQALSEQVIQLWDLMPQNIAKTANELNCFQVNSFAEPRKSPLKNVTKNSIDSKFGCVNCKDFVFCPARTWGGKAKGNITGCLVLLIYPDLLLPLWETRHWNNWTCMWPVYLFLYYVFTMEVWKYHYFCSTGEKDQTQQMIHPRPCNASCVSDGQVNLIHIIFHGQLFARPGFALRIQSGAKFYYFREEVQV